MGRKSKEARRARRDAQRANDGRSSVVDDEEQEAGTDIEPVVEMVVRAVKESGAVVAPRARRAIADLIWQQNGTITLEAIHELVMDTGVVDSVDEANKFWRQLQLQVAEHNASMCASIAEGDKQHETVLVAKATTKREVKASEKGGETKAPGINKAQKTGATSRGHRASETLGMEISKLPRKTKPRGAPEIDEILWSDSRQMAESELKSEFEVTNSLEEYYLTMCAMGKSLLAKELQTRTQRMYDYKARKQFQKENKR